MKLVELIVEGKMGLNLLSEPFGWPALHSPPKQLKSN